MKKYICTWAQNNSAIHKPFWHALNVYAEETGAEILVVQGWYRNPTNPSEKEEGCWWDSAVTPYLVSEDIQLCPNLRLYASLRCQPTAHHPLTGLNVFLGKNSGIIGHPKRALECVPTATRMPRIATTTSAVTVPNYSRSRAGARGGINHVLGALVVEIDTDGVYFLRQISANDDGSFTDLDRTYCSAGSVPAEAPLAYIMGDLHVGQEDWDVIKAVRAEVRRLKPKHLVLHDVLDFRTRNHHDRSKRAKYSKYDQKVEAEFKAAAHALTRMAEWGASEVDVVRSNHDEAAERWLEETLPWEDPANAAYFHSVWSRCFEYYADTGTWPNVFEMESRRLKVPKKVRFLKRGESLKLADVEVGAFHGDDGINGSRASLEQFDKLGVKTVTGHGHSAGIRGGATRVGLSAKLDQGYNRLPSNWTQTMCILYSDGKKALQFIIKGRSRGGQI